MVIYQFHKDVYFPSSQEIRQGAEFLDLVSYEMGPCVSIQPCKDMGRDFPSVIQIVFKKSCDYQLVVSVTASGPRNAANSSRHLWELLWNSDMIGVVFALITGCFSHCSSNKKLCGSSK